MLFSFQNWKSTRWWLSFAFSRIFRQRGEVILWIMGSHIEGNWKQTSMNSRNNSSSDFNTTSSPTSSAKQVPTQDDNARKASVTSQDVDEVAKLFEEKPEAFERWLTDRAPTEALSRLHDYIQSRKNPKRASVTSELFQQWVAGSPIQVSWLKILCEKFWKTFTIWE